MLSSELGLLRIGKARAVVDPLKRVLFYHLYAGGMVRAGYQFGWVAESLDPTGLGVAFPVLSYANSSRLVLRIFLREDWFNAYAVHPQTFLEFALKHQAFLTIKGVLVYVPSLSVFRIVPDGYSKVKELLLG